MILFFNDHLATSSWFLIIISSCFLPTCLLPFICSIIRNDDCDLRHVVGNREQCDGLGRKREQRKGGGGGEQRGIGQRNLSGQGNVVYGMYCEYLCRFQKFCSPKKLFGHETIHIEDKRKEFRLKAKQGEDENESHRLLQNTCTVPNQR